MIKGCLWETGWRVACGVREANVVGHLPLWTSGNRFSVFFLWNLGSKLLGGEARQMTRNKLGCTGEGSWQSCFRPGVMTHPSSTLATAVLFTAPPGGQGTVSRPPRLSFHPLAQGTARRLAGRSPDLHYD